MKVLINSNGTAAGTFIFDSTGRAIEGKVTKIEWLMEPYQLARAVVTFEDVELSAPAVIPDPPGQ